MGADKMTNVTNPVHGGDAYRYIDCATPGCDWTLGVTKQGPERAVEQFKWAFSRRDNGWICAACDKGTGRHLRDVTSRARARK
jgi:hypothetical protein